MRYVAGIGRFRRSAAKLVFALLLALPAAVAAAASGESSYCPITLDDAVTLEREQIEQLFQIRGIPYEAAEAIAGTLEENVTSYLQASRAEENPESHGLLFYIGNADVLCAIFWRVGADPWDREVRIERLAYAPNDLAAVIDELLFDMQESGGDASRRIKLRNAASQESSRGASPLPATEREDAEDPLAKLAEVLFPGRIREAVSDLSSLTILPCLNIGTVPFSALDPDGDGTPLVATTAINIEAELGHIRQNRLLRWSGEIRAAAIFGNPEVPDDPDWELSSLPGAEREARRIAGKLGTVAITGADVTRAKIRDALPQASYIHIAAHGLSSVAEPLDRSFLVVSDGRLVAREIQGLQLSASPLVVLSACQSGLGGRLDAGIIGLARAFIVSGAMQVVATLWNVDDVATETIMVEFFNNLASMAPPEALRRAQEDAWKRWRDPRIWSGFMVFGSRAVLQ
jgi:hypothetical protein